MRIFGKLFATFLLLIVEVAITMLVYTLLNLHALNVFGYLVRLSGAVLESMRTLLIATMPGQANAAYATLFGELGPKAILLLLIGLVVAAILRGLVELTGLTGRR